MVNTEDQWTDDKNVRSYAQMREYTAMADRIAADFPGGQVLDWGCAFGQMSDLLTARGVQVTAFDYDPDGAGVRALPYYPQITAHYSAEPVALPFDDRRFDAVLSSGVLEHVQKPEKSLVELDRVLKPGGTLYVYKLPNETSYLEWLARRLGMYYHGKYQDDRLYTVPKARALLTENGYRVQEIRLANMLPLSLFTGRIGEILAPAVWALNRALARVPVLNRLATNVELVAVKRD
ncbi:MAG: methyltransferase domain-containing protein [Geodermatophilaceae bacterium]